MFRSVFFVISLSCVREMDGKNTDVNRWTAGIGPVRIGLDGSSQHSGLVDATDKAYPLVLRSFRINVIEDDERGTLR